MNFQLVGGYLISKNLDVNTLQYGIYIYPDGKLEVSVQGTATMISAAGTLIPNTLYKLVYYRKSGVLKVKLNNVELYSQANTTTMISMPNLRIGARSTNASGTTHSTFFNGYLGTLSIFYNGAAGLDIAKIEKALHKYNINYI